MFILSIDIKYVCLAKTSNLQQSEDLKEKLGKLSEKLWETPKPFSEKPPSPFYEDKPLKKFRNPRDMSL